MEKNRYLSISILLVLFLGSCSNQSKSEVETEEKRVAIEMVTDKGTINLELYNETPKHRDNFMKLANEGAFDSLLFHRVIEEFMIQGGDPESKYALPGDTLGSGGLDYTVDAEFHPDLFHKKGVLAAARDGNLQRASSSMQFYIVQGKIYNDSLLEIADIKNNERLAEHYFKNDPANKELADAFQKAIDEEYEAQYMLISDSIRNLSKSYNNFERYTIPQAHSVIYKTIGGVPFLDQNYTVFGEVTQGLEIVDSIAAVSTDAIDRPIEDVRILRVRVVE